MVKKDPPKTIDQHKDVRDDNTSDAEEVNPRLQISVEERQYDTIPGLALATCMALNNSTAQVNPIVEREPIRNPRIKKLSKSKARDKARLYSNTEKG